MSSIIPGPPPNASATLRGLVSLVAQTFAGVKTFASTLIAAAGIEAASFSGAIGAVALLRGHDNSAVVRSTLGAGPGESCVLIGTEVADGSANATAKLASFGTGIGGTYVEKAYLRKDALRAPQTIELGSVSGTIFHNGTAFSFGTRASNAEYWQAPLYYQTGTGVALEAASCARLSSDAANGASAVAASSESAVAWANATAKLHSFRNGAGAANEKSAIMANGEFEHAVAGAGFVLKSPDGTRYRLTIANGGTVSIAAA